MTTTTIYECHIASQMIKYKELNQTLYSIPLVWHTVTPVQFPCQFENKYTTLWVEGVYNLDYELCYWV